MKKFLSLVLAGCLLPAMVWAGSDSAVLVMAHGGGSEWNKLVKKSVKEADLPYPTRVFFGMGDTAPQQRDLQELVDQLESSGAHTIYVVPLLVSSYSEVARQWKYLLGVDFQPGFINNPLFPITKHSTIRFGDPLDSSAVVVEILLDRAREISTDPAHETVFIVAHGPNDDMDNQHWNETLQSVANRLKERGGFKAVEGATLRDDAPAPIREAAIAHLRERVKAADQGGARPLVIPLLLAQGGIEHKISLELRGLNYTFNAKTLLPDSRLSDWIRSQVP